ncbi:MAG TPA: insulinase family protein [Myxococcaceae bacterium]|nr:insulinase family protein [Myxococcaceae bacterium]
MRTGWLLVPVLALGGASRGFDVPTRMELRDVPFDVRTVDLPSGMRVVVEKDSSRPLVAVVSVVDVGGANDPQGKEGLAHLVEHLAFRSLQDQKHTFSDLLEVAGAATWNATTSWDLTTYYEVGSKGALESLLALEAARIARPLEGITPAVFETEKQVVKNELLQRDEQGYDTAIFSRMSGALFAAGHPNSRPVSGTEQSIAALTLDDAREFVKKNYRPERVTLLIAGDLDPATVGKSLAERIPGDFVDPPASGPVPVKSRLPSPVRPVEDPKSPREVIRVKAPAEVPMVIIGWPLPSGYDKEGYLGRFVANMIVGASAQAVAHDADLIGVGATLARGRSGSMLLCFGRLRQGTNPGRTAESMMDGLTDLWSGAVQTSSSDRVRREEAQFLVRRNRILVDLASDLEDLGERAVLRAQLVHVTGDTNAISRELASIGQLSANSVASFAFQNLSRGRARVVFLEPDGSPAPGDGAANAFASGAGLQLRIDPDLLRTRVASPGAEIRTFKLDTGLEVVLARRPTAPVVTVVFSARGGSADGEPLGAPDFARYAWPVENAHGRPELYGIAARRRLAKDVMSIELLAGNGNLANALGMLLDQVRSLHVDSAVEYYVDRELRSVYRNDWTLPHESFVRVLWSAVYGTHPLGRTVPPDRFDKVGGGDAQRYLDRAFTPSNGVLAIAGDFDPKLAEEMVRDYFGGWKHKGEPAYLAGPLPSRAGGPVPTVKEVRPGARQTEVRFACTAPASTPADRAAAEVLAQRLGGRIHRFARQMLGTSYGFSARVTPRPGSIELEVGGNVDGRGIARVLALLRGEADGLGARPMEAAELGRAQWDAGLVASTRYEDSERLASSLARLRLLGYPADTLERYPQDLAALTPAAVQAFAAQCRKTAVVGLMGEQATLDRLVPSG